MNFVKPGLYVRFSLICLFVVSILGGIAGLSTVRGAEEPERCLLVSRKGDVIHAKSAKTQETLFKDSDAKKVIQWALENGNITILEPGTYTVNEAVRVSRSGTSLIIKENATLQMPPGFNSSYVSEEGADYYPVVYVAPRDVFSKTCILENVNVINLGTLKACGKTDKKATGRWGGGACIIYDGRKWGKTCGIVGGTIFSSGVLTGCRGAALWILDCKKTEIPLMCAEHYGNGVVAAEGCEYLNIGILAGLAGEKAEENETIDLNYFNENIRIGTVIGTAPSEEILDVNNSPNVTVERVIGYGEPNRINLVGLTTYPRSSCMSLKKYIGNSTSSVVVKHKEVVNKKVKEWKRIVEVPPLPESLPRFAVKAKLIAVFEDGSQQIAFDKTIPFDLTGTVAAASQGDTNYYVDAASGNDDNPGTAAKKAWKTLAPVNAMTLAPGDQVLLRSGCTFTGPLHPKGSGTKGNPIIIDKYEKGPNPTINGEGKTENTIRLHNQHHWQIRNLTVTNTDGGGWDDDGRKLRRGIYVTASDAGDVNHIYLQNLEIRDVRGMYRFAGNQTNGGIICQVLGDKQPTRFVDLRIESCVFRTNSIDRYPVVVTSSWKKEHPGKIVYRSNTLDHTGRAYTVIPADQWPRKFVYFFDPEAMQVFPLEKTAPPTSPFTGRVGCEDIFSEMAARLKRSWSFYEVTRCEKGRWLFKNTPGDSNYGLWATSAMALGYYGELRSFGFDPPWADREKEVLDAWIGEVLKHRDEKDNKIKGPVPGLPGMQEGIDKWGYVSFGFQWQLRNRVFLAGKYAAPPGAQISEDFCRSKETALKLFESLPWASNPYWAGNMIGSKAILNHREKMLVAGKEFPNEVVDMLHKKIDAKFNPDKGYWGGEKTDHSGRNNGNMKTLTCYWPLDWEIPHPKKIIDFTLSGADEKAGFRGRGCNAFNQMYILSAIRSKYPELANYRYEEIDRYTAMTFMTFLSNWNEELNFYADNWNGKHNNGVSLFMPHLLLDYPYMQGGTIYNWQHCPIIDRDKNGRVKVNQVIHQTEGYLFDLSTRSDKPACDALEK